MAVSWGDGAAGTHWPWDLFRLMLCCQKHECIHEDTGELKVDP